MLLELQNLGKSFGEHEVLHDVTAGVERGDRIGIIGANGTGKTTLLRILCGESLPDAGDAAFGTGVTTGYLEQNARLDPALDVYATMKLVFTPALDAMQQMEGLQKHCRKVFSSRRLLMWMIRSMWKRRLRRRAS